MSIASRVDYKVSLCLLLDYKRYHCTNLLLFADWRTFSVPVMDECFEVNLAQYCCMLVHVLLHAFNFHAYSKLHQSTTLLDD